jgi:hypothetical protein
MQSDEIARTLPDTLGCCSGALGSAFAKVFGTVADVAAGTALLGLGGWLGCFSGLAVLSKSDLAADGQSQGEQHDG